MSSILTNTSAMSALQNLASTQKSLNTTQSQISSGLRVASASDNAAYWSISTTMKSDTGALSAVTDALNLGSSVVSTATAALNSTITLLNKMKDDVITAQTSGTDPAQVQTDISAQQASLISIMASASFNGVNLLDGSTATANVVSSFSRNSTGATTIGTIAINTAGIALTRPERRAACLARRIPASHCHGNGRRERNGCRRLYASDSILGFQISSSTTSTDLTALSAAIDTAITTSLRPALSWAITRPTSPTSRASSRRCRTRSRRASVRWSMPT